MTCKLCEKDGPLLNSHIIPEFAYKPAYDEKHRFHVLSTYARRLRPMAQKGLREPLLCARCETQLSQYEHYAQRAIEGGVPLGIRQLTNGIEVTELDYSRLKLFGLSVLWRAGVAKHLMFSRVSLGRHEPILRRMIEHGDPGRADQYGFIVIGISGEHGAQSDWIDQPERVPLDGHTCYRFVFAGFMWVFFVSSHRPKAIFRSHFLQEDGTLQIMFKPFAELGFVRTFGKRLDAMGRLISPNP